jgi:hypothetical protein
LFYRLTHFHQNQRRFLISKSPEQLNGEFIPRSALEDACDGALEDPVSGEVYAPCGLSARSFLNDTFELVGDFPFSESGIAWESDLETLYKPANEGYSAEGRWLDNRTDYPGGVTNEHFVVWMRANALGDFAKPYARCKDCRIPKGRYAVRIENRYPTDGFKGEKWVGLAEEGVVGVRNVAYHSICFSYGAGFLACDVVLAVIQMLRPREEGNEQMIEQAIEKETVSSNR